MNNLVEKNDNSEKISWFKFLKENENLDNTDFLKKIRKKIKKLLDLREGHNKQSLELLTSILIARRSKKYYNENEKIGVILNDVLESLKDYSGLKNIRSKTRNKNPNKEFY
jgi:hypothetical protein